MKIRVSILDNNSFYIHRLMEYFTSHYADELEIHAFSSVQSLSEHLFSNKVDVLMANDDLLPDDYDIPKSTVLAYLSESGDIKAIKGKHTVCKYQRADQLYRDILTLYAELDHRADYKTGNNADASVVVLFLGAAGGVGATSCAAACSMNLHSLGYNVLYLNMEDNGVVSEFFTGEGQTTMSDALYAIKSSKKNLPIKLKGIIRQAQCGVFFYEPFENNLDAQELTGGDVAALLETIDQNFDYDYVIIDADTAISDKRDQLLKYAHKIFLVSDGRPISNLKLQRTISELEIRNEREENRIFADVRILYNRFSSHSEKIEDGETQVFDLIPEYEADHPQAIAERIAEANKFSSLTHI